MQKHTPSRNSLIHFLFSLIMIKFFSIFPPGWPVFLSLGTLISLPNIINPLLGAITPLLLFAIVFVIFDKRTAYISSLFLGFSPMAIFTNASYFSHTTCLFLISVSILLVVLFQRDEKWWVALLLGLSSSMAYSTRELTAVLILTIPLIWIFIQSSSKKLFAFSFFTGVVPVMILYCFYNYCLTGNPISPPRFLQENEYLGFGERTIRLFDYVEIQNYEIKDALINLSRNSFRFLLWTVPFTPLLALQGFFVQKNNNWVKIFGAICILLPLGYCLYPSDGGNQYGSRFYYESIIFWSILASLGMNSLINYSKKAKFFSIFLLVSILIGQFWFISHYYSRQIYYRTELFRYLELRDLNQSIVFISAPSGTMTHGDLIRNSPDIESQNIIFAWNLGEKNRELFPFFQERSYYVYMKDSETGIPFIKPLLP
jgi:hypothetical protein